MSTESPQLEWYSEVPRSILLQSLIGLVLIVTVLGGFGVWAATAPLAAAVIAPGTFVATGENKVVQHLEGGIIRELLVHEGDQVVEGQELLLLDATAAQANSRQLFLRRLRLEGIIARLQAESRNQDRYAPPQSILENLDDIEVKAINDSQRENFLAAKAKLDNEILLLHQNIAALEFQVVGVQSQIKAMTEQRSLLVEELETKSELLEKGLVTRSSVSQLRRAVADAEGDIARLTSEKGSSEAQIARFNNQVIQTRDAAYQAALDEMQVVEAELDAVREQTAQVSSILDRTRVRAPVSGTIIRMHYHTAGGVIESGKAILEILPTNVPLIIEAQVPRMQIDEVHTGQEAAVRLTALNQRTTPILTGEVYYVSADSIHDGGANAEVYLARVSIPNEQLQRVRGFSPTPGMPAEILIQTHERTFFEYLVKPIADSMARAFREY